MSDRLRIENGIILPMDGTRRILARGHVLVRDGRIAAVGPGDAEASEEWRRIDARGGIVLPGLIDGHAHAGHALTKSLGESAAEWMDLAGRIYATATDEAFWRAEAALSALERLRCGTTTAVLLFGGGPDIMRTDDPSYAEAHLAVLRDSGLSETLAVGPNRPSGPSLYISWQDGVACRKPVSGAAQLDVCGSLIARWHGAAEGRIRMAVSLPVFAANEMDEAAALTAAARHLARMSGVLFVQDGHRAGSIALAGRADLLGPDALLAHCIDLTAEDVDALELSEAKVVHNPSALMSVVGRCPAPELHARGITVALGTDAPAPDRPFDMFRTMFQAHRYHARHFGNDAVLPPWDLLEMATIRAARALSLDAEIGSLEPGKRADVIVVDTRRPHLWPPAEPVHRLTRFANGADVATVIVAGRVLMQDGRVLSMDENRVFAEAQDAYATMLARAGLAERFPSYAGATT